MGEITRKTVTRLVVLAALLAAYPVAILVLRSLTPLSVDDELADLEAHLSVVSGGAPCALSVTLRLEHPEQASFGLASIGLSVLEEGQEQMTRLETGSPLEARIERTTEGRTLIGPFCLDLPPSAGERTLMVTTRVTEPASGATRSLLREAVMRGDVVEIIDPEGVQRPDFLKAPEQPEPRPESAP